MNPKTSLQGTHLFIALALVGSLAVTSAEAHRVLINSKTRADGTRAIQAIPLDEDHLVPTPAVVDFGEVLVGAAVTRPVTLVNASARQVTFTASVPAPFTLSSMGPFGLAPGESTSIDVTLQSPSAMTLSHELILEVDHDGTSWAQRESVALTGTVGEPPRLVVTAVTKVGFDASENEIDVGMISAEHNTPGEVPAFDVTVTNTGGLTAHHVRLNPPGPGGDIERGTCSWGGPVAMCLQSSEGTGTLSLGDLDPDSAVTTTWSAYPSFSGPFDIGPVFLDADDAERVEIRVTGEVIPFELPDDLDFLTQEKFADLTEKFGESTDPNEDDPLAELRITGFDARTAFSLGEFDSVDLRTGNLTVMVPIGGEQQVRGPLSYALNAVYNSSLWYRKTMAEYGLDAEGRGKAIPIQALWTDPAFNLVGGWSFHLGRLIPPGQVEGSDPGEVCGQADPLAFEYRVDTDQRYVYFDPSGARHEFWAKLHADEFDREMGETGPDYETLETSYTRDGSLLRMTWTEDSADVRWIEEPNGLRRRFQRHGTGSPAVSTPTLPDEWLLTRIEDPYGNRVDVEYGTDDAVSGQPAWFLRDAEDDGSPWREVVVTFTDWDDRHPLQPWLVDEVRFPGFDGGTDRTYDFQYADEGPNPGSLSLTREHRSAFHKHARTFCLSRYDEILDTTVPVPRLAQIVQPDGAAWEFVYDTSFTATHDDLRLETMTLPTGGEVEYQYATAWDSSSTCGGHQIARDRLGVSRRQVKDTDGTTVLEDTRYLRRLKRTDDVPDNLCQAHPGLFGYSIGPPPHSQQEVGVWSRYGDAAETALTVHHFNVWPYDDTCLEDPDCPDCCGEDGRLESGRTYIERNTMTDPNQADGDLLLSSETYACVRSLNNPPVRNDVVSDSAGDQIQNLLGDCTKTRTTYADYEVQRAGLCRPEYDMGCLLDSRRRDEKTVYHDDQDRDDQSRWVRIDRSDDDGLGHYREEVTSTSSWGPVTVPTRTSYQNFNPDVGTLTLDPETHRVQTDIIPPSTWILDTYDVQWVEENGVYRGGEACFDPTKGHLEYMRTWSCEEGESEDYDCAGADDDGTLTDVRSSTDLVVRRIVSSQGELDTERHYGADTFATPTGDAWCSDSHWAEGDADYAVVYDYDHGFLEEKYVDGGLTKEIDREADHDTGWTASETLDSGEVVSYRYDGMGRVQWITSALTAGRHYEYTAPAADAGWQVDETVYEKGLDPDDPQGEIRSTSVSYDGLGRPVGETLPTDTGGTVTRSMTYSPGGQLASITSLDNSSKERALGYDWAGRLVRRQDFDNSKSQRHYAGIRRTDSITCVDVGDDPLSTGICTNTGLGTAEAKVDRDPFGRVLRTESAEGIITKIVYDPAGRQISASRADDTGGPLESQSRRWVHDGRGFLRIENIPERDVKSVYSNFNTRGQARTIQEREKGESGTLRRSSRLTYDPAGRLLTLKVDGDPVKTFTYHPSGSGKGQVDLATRYNYREGNTSGVPDTVNGGWQEGAWEVESDFGYDAAGRRNSRKTTVVWDPDDDGGGDESAATVFTQGWGYDDLGNVTSITYPDPGEDPDSKRRNCNPCPAARTVAPAYSQGFFLIGVDDDAAGTAASSSLGASSITYHDSGVVHQVVHDQGGKDVFGISGGMPRVASIELSVTGTGPSRAVERNLGSVSYDWAGNIRAIGSDLFDYDLDSRLIEATVAGESFTYGYDDFDNFLSNVGKGNIDRKTNRLTGSEGSLSYDVFGSLTSAGSGLVDFVYDELDKLVQLTNDLDGTLRRNVYDHDDLRVMTQVTDGGFTLHWTLRDGGRVLRDFVGGHPNIALEREYVYAGSRLLASQEVGGPVETQHLDQVGSPRLITKSGGGSRYVDYGPFDEQITVPNPDPEGDPIPLDSGIPAGGFQGHEDDSAFVTYMRGRHYDRNQGRFLQVDPARDGWNGYAFAANNPLSHVDPNGTEVRELLNIALNAYKAAEVVIGRYKDAVAYAAATGAYALNMARYSTMGQAFFETSLWARAGTGGAVTELASGGSIKALEAAAIRRGLWVFRFSVPTATLAMVAYGPDLGADVEHDMTPYDGSTMPGAAPSAPLTPQSTVESSPATGQESDAATESNAQSQSPQASQLHDLLRAGDSATKREALKQIIELRDKEDE